MSTFNLSNEIQIVNPSANVDSHYGTYASLSDAYIGVPEILREKGKTVGIIESGSVIEYWWKSGTADSDLVVKGSSSPISGTTNTIPKFTIGGLGDSQIVDDGTNVTIGGDPGFYKFNVNGEILCKTNLFLIGNSGDIQGYDDSSAPIGSIGFNKYVGANFGTRSELPLYFFTNYTEAMRITTSQNVLIGTTIDSGQKLQVEGDALINGISVGRGGGNSIANVVLGNSALLSNTIGLYNIAIGTTALFANTTGDNNVAIGANSLYLNGVGSENIGIGPSTKCKSISDNNSIIIGFDANGEGSNSVVLGNNSITKTILKGNVLIGTTVDNGFLLNLNGDASINGHTVGRGGGNVSDNVVIGYQSLLNNTTGYFNTAIGYKALLNCVDGYSNIGLGMATTLLNSYDFNSIIIGKGALGAGSNTVVLGNEDIVRTNLKGDVHFPMAILDELDLPGADGQVLSSTATGTKWKYPKTGGLFAQTSNGGPVTATTTETNIIGTGVGTLTVPADSFQIGDSFQASLDGIISCVGTATLHIHVKTLGGVILADTGIIAMDAATNKTWLLTLYFTIRTLGAAGTASISSGGLFSYIKNSGINLEGYVLSNINTTTFDTTRDNTLIITVQWNTNNAGNSILSRNFTLNKIY